MSNLTSIFDVVRGWPNSSALQNHFKQKALVSPDIMEGTVVAIEDESDVPVVDRWTSALHAASGNLDQPWLVMRGLDQTDSEYSEKLACAKLRTGLMFKVSCTEPAIPGDLVYANAGVITITDPGSAPAFGSVVACNEFEGWIIVES